MNNKQAWKKNRVLKSLFLNDDVNTARKDKNKIPKRFDMNTYLA